MAAVIITGTLISNSQDCFFESKTAQLSLGLEKHLSNYKGNWAINYM